MDSRLTRREFIKLVSLLPAVHYLPASVNLPDREDQTNQPNIIILVFDAWSARNMSLYGYPRDTTPNLNRLAEKAIVYHNHYAGDHYTSPGTATILTGVLPWQHYIYRTTIPADYPYSQDNIFGLFETHHRISYTHNTYAEAVINHMAGMIDEPVPSQDLYLNKGYWLSETFKEDFDIASVSWERISKLKDDGYSNSLFLSRFLNFFFYNPEQKLIDQFPLGMPRREWNNPFLLEEVIDWIADQSSSLKEPYLGYFHLLPPHEPYRTRNEFFNKFRNDGYLPPDKPEHPFSTGITRKQERIDRKAYDEFILYVDSEINRLFDLFDKSNSLENTWVVITSDHGEMFERNVNNHKQPTFHQPLINIPLIIFPPEQQERLDVFTPTSNIDLIPSLLHISGKPIPNWLEGILLPPFNSNINPSRSVFAVDAKYSNPYQSLSDVSVMLRKENYKLIYHHGTKEIYAPLGGEPLVELYDLENDPEELLNISQQAGNIQNILLDEMLNALDERKLD